ncbi:MAG TPA: sulfatase [Saprospiraceae bacterium]|nr:sulfatase [Saprospiraceae bacterium]
MRKIFLLAVFTALAVMNARCRPMPKTNGTARNILFIAVDDLKPLLRHYGSVAMHTPNFDRLAKMGVTFTNAQVQQAVCGPSRASIMTGTYPDQTRVWDLHTDFRVSAPHLISMPEYLITQGYETTGIGKIYHKGSTAPGHDGKSWSIPHIIPDDYDPAYGRPAYEYYQDPATKAEYDRMTKEAVAAGKKQGAARNEAFKKLKPSVESADVSDEAYQDGVYAREAISRLKKLKAGGKPFFLAVGFQKPHLPFVAPKKYWDLYDRDKIELAPFRALAKGTPQIAYHNFGELRAFTDIDDDLDIGDQLPEEKQRELIHGYMACVSYIDAQLGKLLDALENEKLADNTVIVLWGDHGYHLGDHLLWNKHSNFEQATRIPLMFAGPGVAKGVVSDHPVELVDVFPTLFELCGVKPSAQVEGKSLLPLLDKDPKTTFDRGYALSQYPRKNGQVMGYSVRNKQYRYTEWHGNSYRSGKPVDTQNVVGVELYDYAKDPNESVNLAQDPAYKQVVKEMQATLHGRLAPKSGGKP